MVHTLDKVPLVLREDKVSKVMLVLSVLMVLRVLMVKRYIKVLLGNKALMDLQVVKVDMVTKDVRVAKV